MFPPFINAAMPKDDSPRTSVTAWPRNGVAQAAACPQEHIAPLLKRLESDLDIDLNVDGAFLEMAEYGPWTMVFVDRRRW